MTLLALAMLVPAAAAAPEQGMVQEAQARLAQARANLMMAEAGLRQAEAEHKVAEAQLAQAKVVSTHAARLAEVGQQQMQNGTATQADAEAVFERRDVAAAAVEVAKQQVGVVDARMDMAKAQLEMARAALAATEAQLLQVMGAPGEPNAAGKPTTVDLQASGFGDAVLWLLNGTGIPFAIAPNVLADETLAKKPFATKATNVPLSQLLALLAGNYGLQVRWQNGTAIFERK